MVSLFFWHPEHDSLVLFCFSLTTFYLVLFRLCLSMFLVVHAYRLPASHDPPLKLYGIPARYANATYSAASKAGELEIVQRDLDAFQNVRKETSTFTLNQNQNLDLHVLRFCLVDVVAPLLSCVLLSTV